MSADDGRPLAITGRVLIDQAITDDGVRPARRRQDSLRRPAWRGRDSGERTTP